MSKFKKNEFKKRNIISIFAVVIFWILFVGFNFFWGGPVENIFNNSGLLLLVLLIIYLSTFPIFILFLIYQFFMPKNNKKIFYFFSIIFPLIIWYIIIGFGIYIYNHLLDNFTGM